MNFTRLIAYVALVASSLAGADAAPFRHAAEAALPPKVDAVSGESPGLAATVALPRGGGIDGEQYVKAVQAFYGTYGVGCLLAPDTIWTQHFNGDLSADGKFFLQGCSVGFVGVAYLLGKIGGGEDAVKAALALSVACGILLPWNAKFGWMTDLSTKQFHAVPEILAATLTVAGVLALN